MPRDKNIVRQRLLEAALELFSEHGFEQTTAAQIATRAGVTERTFFRHFPDKREVLFEGQAILSNGLSQAIAAASPELAPIEVLHHAFSAIAGLIEDNRQFSEPRQHIIAATPSLQEREVAKHAAMTAALAEALRMRGVEAGRAALAAGAGMAVMGYAIGAWFADPSLRLEACLDAAFIELQGLSLSGTR